MLSDFDRESIRVDIDTAMATPDAALAFLRRWGDAFREMAVDESDLLTAELEEATDAANSAEKRADGYENAFHNLIQDVDGICDGLEGGKTYDKLMAATTRAEKAVKDL